MSTAQIPHLGETVQQRWLRRLCVLLGYILLTILFTRPLAWRAGEGYVANLDANADGSYHFNPWHLQHCLGEGTSCLHTDLQCYPVGNSLTLNTNMPIPSLLAQLWGDTTTGLNWVILLNCLLTALGGYLFARLYIRSPWLAFLAGALFAFWMGRSAHLWHGHANLMFAAPLPFALYALHRAFPRLLETERFWELRPAWLGLFVLLSGITALHDLILCGFLVVYCLILLKTCIYRRWIYPLAWYKQILILAGFVILVDQGAQWMLRWGLKDNGAFYFSGSGKNLIYPHPVSAFWSAVFFDGPAETITKPGFDTGRVMLPGMAVWALVLVVVGGRLSRRRGLEMPWLLVVCVLGLLFMFPLIRWTNGRLLYGPFAWTHFIPVWNENRCPTRFADLMMLLGPVWLLVNLERTDQWTQMRSRMQAVAALGLSAFLLAEHVPQTYFFVSLKDSPSVYPALSRSTDPACMFVPFGLVDGKHAFGSLWLEPFAHQPVHQRHMHNGLLSRIDADTWDFFESDTFLVRLERNQMLNPGPDIVLPAVTPPLYAPPDSFEVLSSLRRLQLRQIVFRPGMAAKPVSRYLNDALRPWIVADTTFPEGHRWVRLAW